MKTILFSILILFFINGFALDNREQENKKKTRGIYKKEFDSGFNWKKIVEGGENGSSHYVDLNSIRKINRFLYYRELVNHLEPIGRVYSNISEFKVSCLMQERTWFNVTYYSQSMGKGKIIGEDTFNIIKFPKVDTVGFGVMKFVCDRAE